MGDTGTPKAPQLPPEAPEGLRKFLACTSDEVTLEDGTLSWLPLPPDIKDFVPEGAKPDLSIEPGAAPGTASIKVSLGPLSISLPASVSGGQLTVDTSDPGMFTPQKLVDGINQAVKDINDWFKHKGKGFGQPVFGNKKVTLTSLPGIVTVTDPVISVGSDGFPRMDVTATCSFAGDLVVGSDLVFSQTGTSSLLDRLGLGTPPEHEMSFRTSMRCVTETTGFQPMLEAGCVSVVHEALSADYPSYLHWILKFAPDPAFPTDATLELSYREGASGPLLTFGGFPIVDGKATADTGITSFGEKILVDSKVKYSDGISELLADVVNHSAFFPGSLGVTSTEGLLAGRCPN